MKTLTYHKRYQPQIDRLTESPIDILDEWGDAIGMFAFCRSTPESSGNDTQPCGCLTMIKDGDDVVLSKAGVVEDLTKQIRADRLLPSTGAAIRPEHLPRMAHYASRVDTATGRFKGVRSV